MSDGKRYLFIVQMDTEKTRHTVDITGMNSTEIAAVTAQWRERINPDEFYIRDTGENYVRFDEPRDQPVPESRIEKVATAAPPPITDEDIRRAAEVLLNTKGEAAEAFVEQRIEEMDGRGDASGGVTWGRIRTAILERRRLS